MAESFWKIPDVENLRVPAQIMKEQAAELSQLTDGILRGKFDTMQFADTLTLTFGVIAPRLDNYMVELFRYEQPIQIYPGAFSSDINNQSKIIRNIEEFTEAMKNLLSSDETQRTIGALIAQSK
jgi:hypothetical protein